MTENTLEKLAQLLEQDQFELIFSESGAGRGRQGGRGRRAGR